MLHSIGFAPATCLGDDFMNAPWSDVAIAMQISTYSYKTLADAFVPLMTSGGSLVGLDFDNTLAWPAYNWMGVAKSALESLNRYLAKELGPKGIRSNLVAAGPVKTMAAKSIPGFSKFEDIWSERAPLGWNVFDSTAVAKAVVALLSDWFPTHHRRDDPRRWWLSRRRGVSTTNRLGRETSPYLRQHKDNPVDWYAWGPEAFATATERNVPILLSVGYSACHWCHVMAHESFEDSEVAALMNSLFVNVKVDREERPDVDAVYMDAVQALTGRGGWPMTVFLAPDGKPFYGGTYFPKAQFLRLLEAIDDVWRSKPDDVRTNVDALMDVLGRSALIAPAADVPGIDALNAALAQLGQNFDSEWGGFGAAPKFPSTMNLDLILRTYTQLPSEAAEAVVTTSLDAMASGGIYDHLGGGFARYSVDRQWLVPHFEKMLYDQALLVRVYTHGWQLFGHERWKQVVEETIGYVLGEMTHSGGGWYSAEDADSPDEHGHGHEGLFYTWTPSECMEVLGADLAANAMQYWDVTAEGNFEARNILNRQAQRGDLLRPDSIEHARQLLFRARAGRRRPGLDDKVLTEWNALFLAALAEAGAAFARADWIAAAVRNAEFLYAELRRADGRWYRSWKADGAPRARHDALAADHACLVDAFTRLAEATGMSRWIAAATEVADTMLDHFWDPGAGGLFTTADDGEALIVRQKDLMDNATPSANSVAAVALYRLGALTGETRFTHHADRILRLLATVVAQAPTAFGNALAAVHMRRSGIKEILITGERHDLVAIAQAQWLPNAVVAWGERYESPLWVDRPDGFAYVCENFACRLPVNTAADLQSLLKEM